MSTDRQVARYATPALVNRNGRWFVIAQPGREQVGSVLPNFPTGWTAWTQSARYAGLWPTKQAAAEVLVRQAGYELDLT